MRTLFVTLVALIMTALLGPVVLIASLIGVKERPGAIYQRCMHLWARTITKAAGVRVVVHGAERLPPEEGPGVVFISNHVSWFDIFALASTIPRYTFVAKAELRRIPMFGRAAEACGIVFLDRDNRKAAFESYKIIAREVQRGRSIVVCPEGTRGHDYHLRPFKKGPFVLAIASEAPIIPTIVHGTREVMPKGSFRIRSGVVDVHLLEAVPTLGYEYEQRAELMTVVWNRMADAIQSMYGVGTSEHPVAPEGVRTA